MYKIIKNVPYSNTNDPYQIIDYLLPDNTENIKGDNFGLHIHYHGGAWGELEVPFSKGGDKNHSREVTLAKHAAYIVSGQDPDGTIIALVNYRISRNGSLTDMYQDVPRSFKHIINRMNNLGLNVNQTRISISGAGAGAHLVACMVSRPFDLKKTFLNLIDDVILYGLPANLEDYRDTTVNPYGLIWNWTIPSGSSGLRFSPQGIWFNSWITGSELINYNPLSLMEGFRKNINFIPKFNLHMFHGRFDKSAPVKSALEFLTAYKQIGTDKVDINDEHQTELQELYIAYFGRPADPGGLNFWGNALNNNVTITSIASQFYSSDEGRYLHSFDTIDFLKVIYKQCFGRGYNVIVPNTKITNLNLQKLYLAYFGRPTDPSGNYFYGSALDNGSTDLDAIASSFANSPEAQSIVNLSTYDFLTLVYQQAFSRAYNPGVNTLTGAISLETETEIHKLYIAYFGRPADVTGMRFYGSNLDNGSTTVAEIASSFSSSEEAQSIINLSTHDFLTAVYLQAFSRRYDNAPYDTGTPVPVSSASETEIQKLYIAYFGRPADPAGFYFYGGALDNGSTDLNAIASSFADSNEAQSIIRLGTHDFLTAVYQQAFSRAYDNAPYDPGTPPPVPVSSASETEIQKLYIAYFGRPADPEGFYFYGGALDNGSTDLNAIASSFSSSEEAQSIINLGTHDFLTAVYQQAFSRAYDNAPYDPGTPPPVPVSSASETEIQKLYISYFGRPADPEGFYFYGGALDNGSTDLNAIASSFANSEEAQSIINLGTHDFLTAVYQQAFSRAYDNAPYDPGTPPPVPVSSASETEIQKLYIAYFGRPADPEGFYFYGSELDNGSTTVAAIASSFANSNEAQSIINLGTHDFLTAVYQQAFGRRYDNAPYDPGTPPPVPVSSASETEIQKLYIAYFGRPADPEGFYFYGSELDNGSTTVAAIASSFANSNEAQSIINLGTNAFLSAIYLQAFGRRYNNDPLADGTFWYTNIENGTTTKELAMVQILNGAGGSDILAVNNKVTVAKYFTAAVINDNKIFSGTNSTSQSKGVLKIVTSDSATVSIGRTAAQTAVDALSDTFTQIDGSLGSDGTYWYDQIESGTTTKELAMLGILNGAGGSDATAVNNKVTVAKYFTATVINDNKIFSGANSTLESKNVLSIVTSDSTTISIGNTAALAAIDALSLAFTQIDGSLGSDGTYWYDQIESGTTTKELAMVQILNGAGGSDATAVNNKVTVAKYFTATVINDNKIFSGTNSTLKSKNVISSVTSDSATVSIGRTAALAAIDALSLAFTQIDGSLGSDGTYWYDQIESGTTTKELAMLGILNGAGGSDATAVNNKVTVAKYFTAAVINDNKIFSGTNSTLKSKNVISSVTSDSATVSIGRTEALAAVDTLSDTFTQIDGSLGSDGTYWYDQIESGTTTKELAMLGILNGAQNTDATAVNNKVTVAKYFTATVINDNKIFSGYSSTLKSKNVLSIVTSDSATISIGKTAALAAVDTLSLAFTQIDGSLGSDGTYWYDQIESGTTTKELAMLGILNGAQNTDVDAVNNKVTVAKTYLHAVIDDNKLYSGNIASLEASLVLSIVTSDYETVSTGNTAAQTAVNALEIGNLVEGDNIFSGAGVDGTFWFDLIESGDLTKETAMLDIVNGAQNTDLDAVNNKLIVAETYTAAVIDDNKDFSGTSAITASQALLSAVTSDSATVSTGNTAAQIAVDALNSAPPLNILDGPDGRYWYDQIESGIMPRELAPANIIWGAQNSDKDAVNNKVNVAKYFTNQIITSNYDFSGEDIDLYNFLLEDGSGELVFEDGMNIIQESYIPAAITISRSIMDSVTSDYSTILIAELAIQEYLFDLSDTDIEGLLTKTITIYENSGHKLEELYTDPTQQTDTLIPHPYTFPTDGSLSYTEDEDDMNSVRSLLSDFKAASASAPKFDYTNDPIMKMNIGGIPILDDNGDVTLSEGALKGCGVNMAIDFLDENLNKVLDKGKTIDKYTSALAWCSELQSLGDDIIGNIRGELNIPSISDITDSLPESIGSIAETAIKVGAIYESVQNGGLNISTLNNAMSVINTDYGDALGSIGLDSNKIMSIVSGGDSISSILNGGSLCETMPNISKLASGEVLEILSPVELATKDIKPEMAKPEDIDIIASDNIKKELETELKPTNSLTTKNKELTKSFIPSTNELIGISLGVTTRLKLELPIIDNPRDFRDNPGQNYYSITESITDRAKSLDSGIPRSTPGLVDTDVGVQQLNSFINNKSSDEDPRGASCNMITDMSKILYKVLNPNATTQEIDSINFCYEELPNYIDPGSLISIIQSRLPNEDSTILPTGLLNFDDPNHEGVQKIKDIHEDEKINKFIAEKLNNNNNTRLNSYITQRRLNHLTTIDDDSIESMWKNDPYFNNDIIKEQSGYTDLEYRTQFSRSELIELFELYNQLQAELSE